MSDPKGTDAVVRVLFFAAARDLAGTAQADVVIPSEGCSVDDLARRVVQRFAAVEPYLRAIRWAVNGEYVKGEDRVSPGDEVAAIPPVAGG